MDVAQNNENLLVATAFNSDAIRLGSSIITRTRTCSGMESHSRTGRMKFISEECSRLKAAAIGTSTSYISCLPDPCKINRQEDAFFKIILNVFYLYRV